MALIKCKECENEISSRAKTCPHCGKRRTSFLTKMFAYFFLFVGVISIWAMIQGEEASKKANQKEAARLATLTPKQRAAEEASISKKETFSAARGACLLALKQTLHDPDSAKFGSTSSWYIEKRKNGTILVQPTGRAKNALGAYVNGVWNCEVIPNGKTVTVSTLEQIKP